MDLRSDRYHRALRAALHTNAAATVRRVRHGVYAVPSSTTPGVAYVVRGTALDGSDHVCSCPAGTHG